MKKTSKTQSTQQHSQPLKIDLTCDNWAYNNRHDGNKTSLHEVSHCFSCGPDETQSHTENFQPHSANHSVHNFSRSQLSPVYKHMIVVPDVSSSVSQHKEGSKLSLQLNQISVAFNKENKRIQEVLLEIRQSSVQKDNKRSLKSASQLKRSQSSEKNHRKIIENTQAKLLKFQQLMQKKQHIKQNIKDPRPQTKLKKKNLYELMKDQRIMLKHFGSNLRGV